MYTKLSIPERLKDLRVVDKHLTLEQLAEQTGLSKSALGKYESDDYKDISPFAIATLAKFYGVSTDYLMGVSENKNHPNTELQALHLSDAMVELLSSGKINNRLLCELATHPNFLRLMVDMEIFIDQIADMRVNQMNLILEATRQSILKEHAPGENDLYMRTLELGQVQENDFYSHILHDDLDSIVRDIREAHTGAIQGTKRTSYNDTSKWPINISCGHFMSVSGYNLSNATIQVTDPDVTNQQSSSSYSSGKYYINSSVVYSTCDYFAA